MLGRHNSSSYLSGSLYLDPRTIFIDELCDDQADTYRAADSDHESEQSKMEHNGVLSDLMPSSFLVGFLAEDDFRTEEMHFVFDLHQKYEVSTQARRHTQSLLLQSDKRNDEGIYGSVSLKLFFIGQYLILSFQGNGNQDISYYNCVDIRVRLFQNLPSALLLILCFLAWLREVGTISFSMFIAITLLPRRCRGMVYFCLCDA
jgi:hypothetical protein